MDNFSVVISFIGVFFVGVGLGILWAEKRITEIKQRLEDLSK